MKGTQFAFLWAIGFFSPEAWDALKVAIILSFLLFFFVLSYQPAHERCINFIETWKPNNYPRKKPSRKNPPLRRNRPQKRKKSPSN